MAEKNFGPVQVTSKQVFDTKNPGVKQVSCPDPSSLNGFSSFPVPSGSVEGEGKMRSVNLEAERVYDLSKPVRGDDGKVTYEHKPTTGQQIFDMFEANKQKAMAEKSAQAKTPAPEEKPKETWVNRVSDKLIHETQDPNLRRVSFPDDRSHNGMGNAVIPKSSIIPSKNSKGEVIPGRSSINLGLATDSITYSIKNEKGQFTPMPMTAGELATRYEASQKAFVAGQRTAAKQAEVPTPTEPTAQMTDEMVIE